ncbi:PstS family phosphate ABC transporter substrate-binding protein [Paenibacillus sp. S150]|uniref:PstS family phosphate ABC transporter substrate-binding protein n=1 Tax=Paenibacillus sp. S150 TaxID=2749826 RepID=UPI001C5648A1|nr:substrate-binding domain-containing protein [Paenibacillus sp. S150]MBW4082912.1 substrate-binding domain-containing protein [Paenibacillus sp. S150]
MKRSFGLNLFYTLLLLIALAFAGFIGYFLAALTLGLAFYAPLVVAVACGLGIYSVIAIFQLLSRRFRHLALAVFAGLCLLATAGYELNKAYMNRFEVVDDREVDLNRYKPFDAGSRTAALDRPAAYQIQDQLPRLDGATALYPLYSAFVQAVYPEDQYDVYDFDKGTVICSSTAYAYKRLIAGETDIVFAAAPSLSQQKEALRAGQELKLTPVGREAFVFFVNKRNPVSGLTTEQIKDIYSGKLTRWNEVGGKNNRIRAFQREENSGSQTMLENLMAGRTLMTPPQEDVMDLMSGIISQTSSYRNFKDALGFSFLFYASEMNANDRIKLLAIDGAEPDKESIRSGKYPLSTEFYAVTAGSANPNVQPFLDWIQSSEGQELVEKTGYTSLKQ